MLTSPSMASGPILKRNLILVRFFMDALPQPPMHRLTSCYNLQASQASLERAVVILTTALRYYR